MATFETLKDRLSALLLRPMHSYVTKATDLLEHTINAVIRDMMRRHDFACMESVLELQTTAGTEYVALGDAYKRMARGRDSEGCVYFLDDGKWAKIRQLYKGDVMTLPRLRELYPDPNDTGQPRYCCLWQRRVYFGPTPDGAYHIRVPCYVYLADLSSTNESNWFTTALDDIVLHESVLLGRLYLDQPEAASSWEGVTAGSLHAAVAADQSEAATRVGPRSAVVKAV